jgi:hypothetical protein
VGYGDKPALNVSGLTPNTTYELMLYDSLGLPILSAPFTLVADEEGMNTTTELIADQTILPGVLTIEVATDDGKLVARTTMTVTGTNQYYVQHRLGSEGTI